VSPDTAKAIASWVALPPERFPVIANGIPLERFATGIAAAADVESWLAGRFGIAMTARLVRPKAHEVALSALAMLPERYCMVFAGEGTERERLEALALYLGVGDRCRFLGSRQDIGAILAACRLYVQTSLVEGFGIASLEAMACGLPVVASDAPGLGDLVRGAGLLFPPGDGEACARAIERIAADPGLASSLVSAGFDRANANSIGRCADAYAGLYKSLASPGEIHP